MWFNSAYEIQKAFDKYDKAKKKGKLPSQLEQQILSSYSSCSTDTSSNSTY